MVVGQYNVDDSNYGLVLGNGPSSGARSNAFSVDKSGNGIFAGQVTIPETPVANTDAASKAYVDSQVGAGPNDFLTALSFSGGILTGTVSNQANPTVDLDGRYLELTGGTLMGDLTLGSPGTPVDLIMPTPGSNINLGSNTVASADNAMALGTNNTVSAAYAMAIGQSNNITGAGANQSLAAGFGNTITGIESQAFGFSNTASGDRSTARGNTNTASGANSFASGANSTASAFNSHVMGNNLENTSGASLVVGVWNEPVTNTKFQVGVGTGVNDKKNALDVRNNGHIIMEVLQQSASYSNDANAAAGGVPVGGLYKHGSGAVHIRVT